MSNLMKSSPQSCLKCSNNSNNLKVGHLKLIPGPMWAGKSTFINSELTVHADLDYTTLYINHSIDNRVTERSDDIVTTHSSSFRELSHKIDKIKVSRLSDVDVDKYDVIGIDEGQFFDDIYEVVIDWVNNHHKTVIVAFLMEILTEIVLANVINYIHMRMNSLNDCLLQ